MDAPGVWESDISQKAEKLYDLKLKLSNLDESQAFKFIMSQDELVSLFATIALALDGTPYVRIPSA